MSSPPPALQIMDGGKRFLKFQDQPLLAESSTHLWSRSTRQELWAVRHINLTAMRGECLGVIGRNGAGKSTLLRMLAGVTAPTEGSVTVRGRLAPLVAVGVGFHPELTGRENVFVNGMILGMKREQVEERFNDIVDFAEIGDFLDTPVKFYSSGMFVRLGFAVAVEARPDILLVDEVLAVGDVNYQTKCFNRIMDIRQNGTTVVVVSHALDAIRMMCDRTAVIENGSVAFDGDTPRAISVFHDLLAKHHVQSEEELDTTMDHEPGVVEVKAFEVRDRHNALSNAFEAGEEVAFTMPLAISRDVHGLTFELTVSAAGGEMIYREATATPPGRTLTAGAAVVCDMRISADLPSGSYRVQCLVKDPHRSVWYDVGGPAMFYVHGRDMVGGKIDLKASFEVDRRVAELPTRT